jgi:hypothetical protein
MIRHELQISQIRFYNIESDDPFFPFDAICSLVWETKDTVWVKGFHGKLSRQTLREFLQFLIDNDIKTVKAFRSVQKTLPGIIFRKDNFTELSVDDLARKYARLMPK